MGFVVVFPLFTKDLSRKTDFRKVNNPKWTMTELWLLLSLVQQQTVSWKVCGIFKVQCWLMLTGQIWGNLSLFLKPDDKSKESPYRPVSRNELHCAKWCKPPNKNIRQQLQQVQVSFAPADALPASPRSLLRRRGGRGGIFDTEAG